MKRTALSLTLALAVATLVATQLRSSIEQRGQPEPNLFGPPQQRVPEPPVDRGPRRLPYEAGVDVASRIRGDDSSVEIVPGSAPPLYDAPGDRTPIEANTSESDAVAVIRVTAKRGVLTPGRDWINSHISADVVNVIKNTASQSLSVGSRIEFTDPAGGALMVGTVRVSARVEGAGQFEPGETYLVFFQSFNQTLFVSPEQKFVVRDGSVHGVGREVLGVDGLPLDTAIAQVISARDMPRRGARR